jgi:N-acetyl-anhydromuramyl-L-alanine amidase AmpD
MARQEGTVTPAIGTRSMYHSSARLSAWCCKKYKIPIDSKHIIGHYQVPCCSGYGGGVDCHTCPGPYWNWNKYMHLINYYRSLL